MSKQSEAKKTQRYTEKPFRRTCSSCIHYRSLIEIVHPRYGNPREKESHLRCAVGGFKILKQGLCDEHRGHKGDSQ